MEEITKDALAEWKNKILNLFEPEIQVKIRSNITSPIIDEAIEGVLSGKALINGKKPETDHEKLYCMGKWISTGSSALSGFIKGLKLSGEFDNITVNYRGKSFDFKN